MIPEDEQPYKIPDNWRWVRLANLSEIISKGTTPKGGRKIYSEQGINFLRVENLNDDGTISHDNIEHISEEIHYNYLKRSILKDGDILISIAGTLGKTGLVRKCDLPLNINQAICFIRLLDGTDEKYIKYCFDNPDIKNSLLLQTRTTAIPNLTLKIIGNILIPLPPLDEQKKIVDIIERLFEKLDKAKALAQKIVDNYELRRSVILHKAFDISYFKVKLSKVLSVSKETTTDFSNPNVKYISLDNIKKDCGIISYENTKKIKSTKNVFKMGQILYGKLRPYLNKHDVAKFDGICSTDIIVFNHCDNTLADYINYYFDTEKFINYIVPKAKGNTLPRVTKKDVLEAECPLPPYEKQKEIVRILDNLLSKEQRTKEIAEQTLQKIDMLKKIILARAFRGEL